MIERIAKLFGARTPRRREAFGQRREGAWPCVFSALIAAVAFHAKPCGAQSKGKEECVAAYEQAQVAKQEGDLLKAERQLVSCAGAGCPDAMQADCTRWLEEVHTALPSVVFRALTESGADIADARVELDGQPERILDGRAIAVNPGTHRVIVRAPHFAPVTFQAQFAEGQKLRQETLTLYPIAGSAPRPESVSGEPGPRSASQRRLTVVQWVGAGSAVVGALGLTYFGLKARAGETELDGCSPICSTSAVAEVKRDYVAANISLGLGIVGLTVATLHYLLQGSSTAVNSVPKHDPKAAAGALHVELSPSFAGLSGSF